MAIIAACVASSINDKILLSSVSSNTLRSAAKGKVRPKRDATRKSSRHPALNSCKRCPTASIKLSGSSVLIAFVACHLFPCTASCRLSVSIRTSSSRKKGLPSDRSSSTCARLSGSVPGRSACKCWEAAEGLNGPSGNNSSSLWRIISASALAAVLLAFVVTRESFESIRSLSIFGGRVAPTRATRLRCKRTVRYMVSSRLALSAHCKLSMPNRTG